MKDLPFAARLYVGAVLTAGLLLLGLFGPRSIQNPILFAVLLGGSALASAMKVSLPLSTSGSMSVSHMVNFASLLLLGANETMLVAAVSAWSQCTFRSKGPSVHYRTLFSMASVVLTVKAAGCVYAWLGGPPPGSHFAWIDLPAPLAGAATTYFVCNTSLIATALGLSTGQPIVPAWNDDFLWNRVRDHQRQMMQASRLHLATIEALALAIDAKDQMTEGHLHRIQVYATGLARSLGMGENEILGVQTAALLHDIGKLAVPEHILSKPGPLTQEEFQKIRLHPQVGADIIRGVPFPYPVAPFIMSHHERWDGKGYPSGLTGDEIPLGARILSVVDYFDALMSERPYHKAMSLDAALGLLRQEGGKALDPRVVQTFIDTYDGLAAQAAAGTQSSHTRSWTATDALSAQPAVGLESPPPTNVFEDIARAHREIYALYDIAQAMGTSLGVSDTMALISSKLSKIVPFSCCALFLYNDDNETLDCPFATGVESESIRQLTIRNGDGLAGWVARNRRPLVSGRPSADFEAGGVPSDRTTLHSALVCPLLVDERFIGTISVYHSEPSIYTDDHRRLLDRVSEQAAAVISNSIVFEQTQEDSLTDPLTGLPNTRFMLMHLTRELARAERLTSEVSLLVMDLDDFKDVNDTYGHHVGDRALRDVAAVLRAGIRPYDICVRYAGDEFILVLSGCGGEEAERKRLELQRAVDNVPFEARPGQQLPLAISAGASVFPHDGNSYEALLATADARMLRDKTRRKRNGSSDPAAEPPRATAPTEADLRRAAAGVL